MLQLLSYFARYQGFRSNLAGWPLWARFLLLLIALPGLLAAGLSILALGVSILALLILTMPVYRLLGAILGGRQEDIPAPLAEPDDGLEPQTPAQDATTPAETVMETPEQAAENKPRRTIDVRIIE